MNEMNILKKIQQDVKKMLERYFVQKMLCDIFDLDASKANAHLNVVKYFPFTINLIYIYNKIHNSHDILYNVFPRLHYTFVTIVNSIGPSLLLGYHFEIVILIS